MGLWLLDVNMLLAWLWPKHQFHADTLKWIAPNLGKGWATCPLTETGFLRVVSNPVFSPLAPALSEARKLLQLQLRPELGHTFWPADLGHTTADFDYLHRVLGHQQITDAYLLGLAIRNHGCLVTRDRRIKALAAPGSEAESHLLIIP